MSLQLGNGIKSDQAKHWEEALRPHLHPGEQASAFVNAPKFFPENILVVTGARFLAVQTAGDCRIIDEFPLEDVIRVYTTLDHDEPVVHVPLVNDGHYLIRVRHVSDNLDAQLLVDAIRTGALATAEANRPPTLMPSTVSGAGESILSAIGADYLNIVIPRDEVEAGYLGPTLSVLSPLLESPRDARAFMERVSFSFHGYDETTDELWEIPEVRDYV